MAATKAERRQPKKFINNPRAACRRVMAGNDEGA
jgi:hypothetical protein